MSFGEVVEQLLEERGMSQSELARRLGVGRSTVNAMIRKGNQRVFLDMALEIATVLGVTIDEIVDRMRQ